MDRKTLLIVFKCGGLIFISLIAFLPIMLFCQYQYQTSKKTEPTSTSLSILTTLKEIKVVLLSTRLENLKRLEIKISRIQEEIEGLSVKLYNPDDAPRNQAERDGLLELLQDKVDSVRPLNETRASMIGEIRSLYEEIDALDAAISAQKDKKIAKKEILNGTWTIILMPKETRGTMTLIQTGTIVAGEYELENGLNGNLQGTFVSGRINLERIDSKLGNIGRFTGDISADQKTIMGVWNIYDLATGEPSTGAFRADKKVEE